MYLDGLFKLKVSSTLMDKTFNQGFRLNLLDLFENQFLVFPWKNFSSNQHHLEMLGSQRSLRKFAEITAQKCMRLINSVFIGFPTAPAVSWTKVNFCLLICQFPFF